VNQQLRIGHWVPVKFGRAAAEDLSPGLQPWVHSPSESALEGRPKQTALNRRLSFMANQRDSRPIRFVRVISPAASLRVHPASLGLSSD
jgi:hypothetical protein